MTQACLGDTIKVETIDGPVELTIPDGTQNGVSFKLKGKGVTKLQSSGRGDQYVHITVEIPKRLSEKERDILRSFDEAIGGTLEANKDNNGKKSKFGRRK